MKQVLEPAGAAALAAVLLPVGSRSATASGSRSSISGGNVEVGRLGELIAAAARLPGASSAAA